MEQLKLRKLSLRYKILTIGLLIPVIAWGAVNSFDLLKANRLDVDNTRVDGNTISSTNTDGNLVIDPNGTGLFDVQAVSQFSAPSAVGEIRIFENPSNGTNYTSIVGTSSLGGNTSISLPTNNTTLVGTDSSQTLTNKEYNLGTATDNTNLILPSDTKSNLDGLTRVEAAIYYATDQDKVYADDGSILRELGSGSGGSSGINMYGEYNPGAEDGVVSPWSENGGGTLAVTSTAANVANGTYALSYDASANNDYMTISETVNIPAGLYGNNCLLQFYYKGFDENITFQVHDGTNVVIEQVATAATTYTTASLNFICPSSGALYLRILASADAAIGYVDEIHLGSALNLSNVSQASFIGSAYYATTANCLWTVTSATLADFSTDTDCPAPTVISNPGPGTISTSDANLPQLTIDNLPPGNYKVMITGSFGPGSNANNAAAITDGTTTSPGFGSTTNSGQYAGLTLFGDFSYTTAGSRTFKVQGSATSGTFNINTATGTGIDTLRFSIYRFPNSSQQAFKPDASPSSWSGYHDNTCSWSRTNTGYDDPTADASCALVERTNTNFGTVTTYTVTNAMPGIVFTPKKVQSYFVCAAFYSAGTGADLNFRMIDGGSTVISDVGQDDTASATNSVQKICGIYKATSVASKTLRIQTKASSGAVVIGGETTAAAAIEWTIFALDQSMPAPLLVNSVVSKSSGVYGIETAKIAGGASRGDVSSESGDWLDGDCTDANPRVCTIHAGVFSATPNCVATDNDTTGAGFGTFQVVAESSTSLSIQSTRAAASGTAADSRPFNLICMGPR